MAAPESEQSGGLMLIVKHGVNTISELIKTPREYGVEVDIRDYDGEVRLTHEPFMGGEKLTDFLGHYCHAFLIVNVKCEGLERILLNLMRDFDIRDFLFMDVAQHSLIQYALQGVRPLSVRLSAFEPVELSLAFAGLVDWVWIDTIAGSPLTPQVHARLKPWFKLGFVSPELHGYPRDSIQTFRRELISTPVDLVCTDYCEDWE